VSEVISERRLRELFIQSNRDFFRTTGTTFEQQIEDVGPAIVAFARRVIEEALKVPTIHIQAIPRLETSCPSCGCRTIFIGVGGHLTCSNLQCAEPSVEAATAALRHHVERNDRLLLERDKVLDALMCPTHGRCVPHAMQEIARLKNPHSIGADQQPPLRAGMQKSGPRS